MNLTKIHSITKKILVAFLGGFLLLFILFHASANLLILREDDGAWYSAFCHFMGTNYIVKAFEILLFLTLLLHIIITLWLAYTNYKARGTVRYHERSRTKTHSGSKLMAWTGALILCLIVVHFFHFYLVKMDIVEGQYMVKTDELAEKQLSKDTAKQLGFDTPVNVMELANSIAIQKKRFDDQIAVIAADSNNMRMAQLQMMSQQLDDIKSIDSILGFAIDVYVNDMICKDLKENGEIDKLEDYKAHANGLICENGKWIKNLNKDQKIMLKEAGMEVEPDFYTMARQEFKNPLMVILYLIFFVVLFIHMRHAFPSAFQTLGLNNYTYNKALDVCGLIYAIVVCLMFTVTVLGVCFFV